MAFDDGPLAGENALDSERFSEAVQSYYAMSGWDPATGLPTAGKLAELGLDEPLSQGMR